MCVNFIYDLNGSKGPNTVGKDIGVMTVFNSMDSIVVAPMPSSASDAGQAIWENATKLCNNDESERLPNIDELSSLFINKDIVNLTPGVMSWSGSPYSQAERGESTQVRVFESHVTRLSIAMSDVLKDKIMPAKCGHYFIKQFSAAPPRLHERMPKNGLTIIAQHLFGL